MLFLTKKIWKEFKQQKPNAIHRKVQENPFYKCFEPKMVRDYLPFCENVFDSIGLVCRFNDRNIPFLAQQHTHIRFYSQQGKKRQQFLYWKYVCVSICRSICLAAALIRAMPIFDICVIAIAHILLCIGEP